MITSVVVKEIYPKVEKAFSDKKHVDDLNKIVSNYIDINANRLSTIGPVKRTIFTDLDKDKVFNIVGITPTEISEVVKKSGYIKGRWKNITNPFNIIMALTIRFFKLKKDEKSMKSSIVYLTLSMYPSLHSKYFKYEPNEQIMTYTINNLSKKYKVKQTGTILFALVDTTIVSDKHYSKNLIRCNDKDLTDYVQGFKTRINSLIKKICSEFMICHDNGNYLNMEVDNEDENNFSMADSNSYLISRLSDAVSMQLSVSGPNSKLIVVSSKFASVSVNEMRNTINDICRTKDTVEDVKKLVSAILYLFLFDGKNKKEDLHGNAFFLFSLEIYKKSNTSDENVKAIKFILDKWLTKYSDSYRKTQYASTINNFRKALFVFFVFTIQRTNI